MESIDQHPEILTIGASNRVPNHRIFVDPFPPCRRTESDADLVRHRKRGECAQIGHDFVHIVRRIGRRRRRDDEKLGANRVHQIEQRLANVDFVFVQMRVESFVVFEQLKAGHAKPARAYGRDRTRHAAGMRDQILGPNLDPSETGVANDAKLVLERTRQRDGVDGEASQVHSIRPDRTAVRWNRLNGPARRPFVIISQAPH